MDRKQDIEKLQTELKDFDVSSIGRTANDTKANKGDIEKRKICLLNAFKNLQNIEEQEKPKEEDLREFIQDKEPELLKKYEEYKKESVKNGLNLAKSLYKWLVFIENREDILEKYKEENEKKRDPLSIEKEEVFNICLSTGGGADGFKLFFQNGELQRGVYYMADWGEYKEVDLNDDEAEQIYNFYMFGDVESFK